MNDCILVLFSIMIIFYCKKTKKLYKITVNPPTKGRLPITVVYMAKLKENIKNKILWRNVPDEKGALKKE